VSTTGIIRALEAERDELLSEVASLRQEILALS
jgi:hypothetical protein